MLKRRWAAVLFLSACGVDAVDGAQAIPDPLRAKAPDGLWQRLEVEETTFIVSLSPASDVAAIKADLGTMVALDQEWSELPLAQVRAANLDAAMQALDRDGVEGAFEIEQFELTDAESFPLIDQPAAINAGKTGAGTSVAVLDTGADYTRSDFGSCTSPGSPSTCRVAYAHDFAPDDGSRDADGHGTNVSAIVAGVAPGTKILALDVFNGSSASSSDIISAINWAIQNRTTYNIASLNLSLGGGSYTAQCSNDAMGIALDSARKQGIAPVVASGNSGTTNALSSPACAPAAISVGAVYDANVGGLKYSNCTDSTTAADQITCFSSSASFLSLLAPGALITAGGYTMAGTSQATPHVAGAFAILHAANPGETVDQELARLTTTGKKITDKRNSITTPRIDVFAALGTPDKTAPTGTIKINNGAASTKTAAVTLTLAATDDRGVTAMCISDGTSCTSYTAYATSATYTLAAGDGTKTLRAWYRDAAGNISTAASASILLDTTAPTASTLAAVPTLAKLALAWSASLDSGSGLAGYRLVGLAGATAPASCAAGTLLYAGTGTTFVHTVAAKATWSYRLCALDNAANTNAGATRTASAL